MRTDEDIKKDIVNQLYWDSRIDASNVKVEVNNGYVVLEGHVPSYRAKQAAFSNSFFINGVEAVDNLLGVSYTYAELPTDDETAADIEENLLWDPDINADKIQVSVNNGFVTLRGNVDAYWKKLAAETHAENVLGVVGISNNISVVPTKDIADELVAQDIADALERNTFVNSDEINVRVENGRAVLSGEVPDRPAKEKVFRTALYTNGVLDVDTSEVKTPA